MNKQDDNWEVVNRFALVAERFCSLVDSAATVDRTQFVLQIYRMLPELIDEAHRLPLIEFEDDGDDDSDVLPDESVETTWKQFMARAKLRNQEWEPRYRALQEKLGDWDLYWLVFDPTDYKDHEAIRGSLADAIASIYCTLRKGIRLMEDRQAPAEDIIFEWRFNYYIDWGRHAIDALKTMHVLLQDELTDLNRPD